MKQDIWSSVIPNTSGSEGSFCFCSILKVGMDVCTDVRKQWYYWPSGSIIWYSTSQTWKILGIYQKTLIRSAILYIFYSPLKFGSRGHVPPCPLLVTPLSFCTEIVQLPLSKWLILSPLRFAEAILQTVRALPTNIWRDIILMEKLSTLFAF